LVVIADPAVLGGQRRRRLELPVRLAGSAEPLSIPDYSGVRELVLERPEARLDLRNEVVDHGPVGCRLRPARRRPRPRPAPRRSRAADRPPRPGRPEARRSPPQAGRDRARAWSAAAAACRGT